MFKASYQQQDDREFDLTNLQDQNTILQMLANQRFVGNAVPQVQLQSPNPNAGLQQRSQEKEYDLTNLNDVNEIFAIFAANSQSHRPRNIRRRGY